MFEHVKGPDDVEFLSEWDLTGVHLKEVGVWYACVGKINTFQKHLAPGKV